MKEKCKNNAFSAVEVLVAVAITCFIGALILPNVLDVARNVDALKLKNAYLNFKSALEDILIDPILYSQTDGLADLSTVNETSSDGSKWVYSGETKFHDLIFKKLEINLYSSIPCAVMLEGKKVEKQYCFQSENALMWYVPSTDFVSKNMVEAQNPTGSISKYLPITIYPSVKSAGSIEDFNQHAVIIGVRQDGATTIITNVDCEAKENSALNQCKFIDYISKAKTRY